VTIYLKILLTTECSVTKRKCPEKHKVWPPKADECVHNSIHTKMTNHTSKTAVTDDNFQNKLELFSFILQKYYYLCNERSDHLGYALPHNTKINTDVSYYIY